MKAVHCIYVTGPLTRFAEGFAASLTDQGYAELSLRNQLRLVAHFSDWLRAKRIDIAGLTRQHVEQYVRIRRRTRTCWVSVRGLAPLLKYLGHDAILQA